jgi:hypothetical protein
MSAGLENSTNRRVFELSDQEPRSRCRSWRAPLRKVPDTTALGSERQCLTCGRVGCCDSSPTRHARAHAATTGHYVVRSLEPGENWRWCYAHEQYV